MAKRRISFILEVMMEASVKAVQGCAEVNTEWCKRNIIWAITYMSKIAPPKPFRVPSRPGKRQCKP